jgi:type I restriction enzyme S subunit
LNCVDYREYISGSTRDKLTKTDLSDIKILLPTTIEQIKIGRYLDHQTSIIDQLIHQKEKLIELLKEKRQAVINEAVTKGLNPNAKMKNSGMDSFGFIPEDWTVTKLKHISNVKGRIGFRGYTTDDLVEQGSGALALDATHITWDGDIDLSNPVYISWPKYEESPEIKLNKGDIIIVQRGSTCGKVAIISSDIGPATINPSLVVLKDIKANPYYIFVSIKAALQELVNLTRSAAIPMLSQEQIGNLQIVIPPIIQQNEVSDFLEETKIKYNDSFNKLISLNL